MTAQLSMRATVLVAVVAALATPAQTALAKPSAAEQGLDRCNSPLPGRYALLGVGFQGGQPVAALMQERWLPGGRLEGVRYLRQGRRLIADRYTGSIKASKDCWASIERRGPAGVMLSGDTLDAQGLPTASLVTRPEGVLSLRYVNQGEQSCSATQLNGLVTSQQQGQSWQQGRWIPNAVVQREWWQDGQVRGVALSSYGGRVERAPYSGSLDLTENCVGSMRQRDAKGTAYNYTVLVFSRGSGYAYLQTDPNDMTLGVLQHQR